MSTTSTTAGHGCSSSPNSSCHWSHNQGRPALPADLIVISEKEGPAFRSGRNTDTPPRRSRPSLRPGTTPASGFTAQGPPGHRKERSTPNTTCVNLRGLRTRDSSSHEDDICFSAARLFFATASATACICPCRRRIRSAQPDAPTPENVFRHLERFRPTLFFRDTNPLRADARSQGEADKQRAEAGFRTQTTSFICANLRFGRKALPTDIYYRWKRVSVWTSSTASARLKCSMYFCPTER